jgi:hypothetical protein
MGRRARLGALALALVALTVLAAVAPGRPLLVDCPGEDLPRDVCLESIEGALARGLRPPHPLVLSASAAPGPASGPRELGHRATVSFLVLAIPPRVDVRLYYDLGGRWGAEHDRSRDELAAWWATPVLLLGGAAMLLGLRAGRGRRYDGTRGH